MKKRGILKIITTVCLATMLLVGCSTDSAEKEESKTVSVYGFVEAVFVLGMILGTLQ